MSQKKENKPCNQFEQGQGKQKARSQQQVSDKSSLIGGAGNSNNGGQAGT